MTNPRRALEELADRQTNLQARLNTQSTSHPLDLDRLSAPHHASWAALGRPQRRCPKSTTGGQQGAALISADALLRVVRTKSLAGAAKFLSRFGEEADKGDRPAMSTAQRVTSAQHRRVQWRPIDRALAPFSTASLLVLLEAALASPGCSRFHDHLLLLWTRVLRTPPRPGREAGA